MQVLRVCNFCAFSLPPAFPPCYCPLTFRHQVRWVTYRISSESYPGNQECVATCHGAGEFTSVHHTIHPAPSPPDAGRYTVPSRFGCQSGDCGYRVRGLCTGRYLPAHPRRILLMEQQVWSILHARQSTLRPRVAVPRQEMVKQRLWAIVRVPDTGVIAVECCPVLEIPLCYKPIKRPGIPKQVVNVRLLIFPELGRSMLADRVDQAVGMDHRQSFRIRVTMIPRSAVSQVSLFTRVRLNCSTGTRGTGGTLLCRG